MSATKSDMKMALMVARTFSTPDGKETLKLMMRIFLSPPSYVKGDTHDTAFREGQKKPIRWIKTKIAIAKGEIPMEEEE